MNSNQWFAIQKNDVIEEYGLHNVLLASRTHCKQFIMIEKKEGNVHDIK